VSLVQLHHRKRYPNQRQNQRLNRNHMLEQQVLHIRMLVQVLRIRNRWKRSNRIRRKPMSSILSKRHTQKRLALLLESFGRIPCL
jgi:hypothetical protein